MIGLVLLERGCDLFEVRFARGGLRLRACTHKVWDQDAYEYSNDRYNDHHLD